MENVLSNILNIVEIFVENEEIDTFSKFFEKYRVNLNAKGIFKNCSQNNSTRETNIISTFLINNANFLSEKLEEYKTNNAYEYSMLSDEKKQQFDDLEESLKLKEKSLDESIPFLLSTTEVQKILNSYIFSPISISVHYKLLNSEIIETQGTTQSSNLQIETDFSDNFQKMQEVRKRLLDVYSDELTIRNQKYTVVAWVKQSSSGEGRFINLTPFLLNLNLSSSISGSHFNFNLAPVVGIYRNEQWEIDNIEFFDNNYFSQGSLFSKQSGSQLNEEFSSANPRFTYSKNTSGNNRRDEIEEVQTKYFNNFFFERVLFSNDVIFICPEQIFRNDQIFLSSSDLKDVNFEMIGLVDNVRKSLSGASNVSISVGGRDLMKLLIDDGTNFFANSYNNGYNGNIFFNLNDLLKSKSFLRIQALGSIIELIDARNRSIQFLLNFLFSRIANIQICPDNVFDFKEDKSSFYRLVRQNYKDKTGKNQVREKGVVITPNSGIWSVVKLAISDEVKNLLIVDDNLSNFQGSLLNYVNKVCQPPFVEFFGETVGNNFYFIVRRPPYDYDSFVDLPISTIKAQEIKSLDLQFNTEEIYSSYNLNPIMASYLSGNVQTNFLTAVFFPEYAEIWGARVLDVRSNYLQSLEGENKLSYKELIKDLKYMIRSNAYLPFTRQGSITIEQRPDIRKGTLVKLEGTDEIFYVNSVSTSYISGEKVNGTTTINVSRGMVQKYLIDPKVCENNKNVFSYFNLIRFSKNFENATGAITNPNDLACYVNKEVFQFFLNQKQFA